MSERAGIEYELKVTRLANETLGRYYNEQKARAEKAERELAEARATIEQADTTRREWEVRAATSYRDGRAAGLLEAAAKLAELRDEWEVMMGDGSVAHNCGKIAHGHVIALAPPAVETVSHTITATSADGAKASPYMCDAPAAEPRDEGEVSDE